MKTCNPNIVLVSKEPFGQFKAWFEEARSRKDIIDPAAACLATVNKEGCPSARFMVIKDFDKEGFKFFTNYTSHKSRHLDENPNVAATYYWNALNRSVRIEGCVQKLSISESERFFQAKSMRMKILATVSQQDVSIESKAELTKRICILEGEYANGGEIPKPKDWGGYNIHPISIEFVQCQPAELSDRIRFRKPSPGEKVDGRLLHQGEDGWVYERLAP